MDRTTRRRFRILAALVLAVALLSAPALAHAGHGGHEEESGLSIWPFLAVFGTILASGSVVAGYRFDVERQFAVGMGAGGLVMAAVASTVWLL